MSVELKQFEDKMKKTVENLASDYTTIRAGRANPHIIDKITVDYYGTPSNLQSVANISVSEARTLLIQPWEPSLIKEIEKAILVSDIGLTPNNDGKVIRLSFPELTEERRKELVKDVKKKGEDSKVAIRNIRRDANDMAKKQQKANEISEDEQKDAETSIQKMTELLRSQTTLRICQKKKEKGKSQFWKRLAEKKAKIFQSLICLKSKLK